MDLSRIFGSLVFLCFLALICFMGSAIFWLHYNSAPKGELSGYPISVTIPSGMSGQDVGIQLKKAGLIRSTLAFRFWLGFYGVANRLKPGTFEFAPPHSIEEIIGKIVQGQEERVVVTIPEGLPIARVAKILDDSDVCSAASFTEAANSQFLLKKIFGDWGEIENPEGLAFPETYTFSRKTPANQVAETLFSFSKEKVDEKMPLIASQGLSPYEACILASIVEREGKLANDRPVIASVFLNRLRKGIKLESCATVQFAQGYHKDRLLFEDLKIDSPYNTYLNKGLPPTPISNFGDASLRAVASPTYSNFIYFVSDASGGHHFSETLSQHEKSKKKFFQDRKRKR